LSSQCTGQAAERPRVAEFEVQVALSEQPGTALLHEGVEVAKVGHHDLPLALLREHVVGDAVGLAGATVALERRGVLPVEVHCDLILVESVEHRG
jgi:hypothetical protein